MWRCENVEMWKCGDVEVWKCGNVKRQACIYSIDDVVVIKLGFIIQYCPSLRGEG